MAASAVGRLEGLVVDLLAQPTYHEAIVSTPGLPASIPPTVLDGSSGLLVCPTCAYAPTEPSEPFCPRDGAFLVHPTDLAAADHDPLLGRRIGDFAVVARIGSGGMGTVYRAIQIGIDRTIALKVLRPAFADNPAVVQRFLQEAKAAARLQHRNVVLTFTSGSTQDGLFYIAMEYIPGPSLSDLISQSWDLASAPPRYTLSPARALRLFSHITTALTHAHRLGIVHRDLKPDNVLIFHDPEEGEQAKIVDFGIAKILHEADGKGGLVKTDAHTNLGTALYMAPERFAGAPGDPRMDVYALGLLLHELLTGFLPFATRVSDRETPTVLLHKRLTQAVPALSTASPISPALVLLHADLLERDPQRRPASAGEVRARLRDIPDVALSLLPDISTRFNLSLLGVMGALGQGPSGSARSQPLRPSASDLPVMTPQVGATGSMSLRALPPEGSGSSLPPMPMTSSPTQSSLPPSVLSLPPVSRQALPSSRSVSTSNGKQVSRAAASQDPWVGSPLGWVLLGGCLVLAVLVLVLFLA